MILMTWNTDSNWSWYGMGQDGTRRDAAGEAPNRGGTAGTALGWRWARCKIRHKKCRCGRQWHRTRTMGSSGDRTRSQLEHDEDGIGELGKSAIPGTPSSAAFLRLFGNHGWMRHFAKLGLLSSLRQGTYTVSVVMPTYRGHLCCPGLHGDVMVRVEPRNWAPIPDAEFFSVFWRWYPYYSCFHHDNVIHKQRYVTLK